MAEQHHQRGFTLRQIAAAVKGHIQGDPDHLVTGLAAPDEASGDDLTFFFDPRYRESLAHTRAGAVLVGEAIEGLAFPQIIVPEPKSALARIGRLFAPPLARHAGVSAAAQVHASARLGKDVSVYPFVYVGRGVVVGDGTTLFPGVYVGEEARIGEQVVLYPNVVVLDRCQVGNRVVIHAGSVIGSDGFGYVREGGVSRKVPQLGTVRIDDDVEIGANNCIDRATLGKTWVQAGVKTDNLVQIAHNVTVGAHTVVVAQAALGGSARIGRGVIIGGQAAIADHLTIGDGAMIGSQAGVAKSVPAGEVVSGTPGMPHRLWLRVSHLLTRLPEVLERLRGVERRLDQREK